MQAPDKLKGHILIASEIEQEIERLESTLKPLRVVSFFEENFKIEHAKLVTAEAYISESETKYIIIAAVEFTTVAQNSLLKLLEEPPKNIEFIIISPTKSNLLPTVRSRLPILKVEQTHQKEVLDIHLAKIDYKEIFDFLKANARVSKNEAKGLVEALYYRATVVDKLILSERQLDNFDKAYRLLDLNARAQSVFAMLLMSFTGERG
ncbi:DNA polymerase III subunit delta' [Sulfurimonas paralvinellae]|uniref:DNA polymerase III subunit delta n=1 Tax=Sulfurimonas paralvinellae TaxID=317658 RepID=A0A7M1B998_9BACT|nr:DNA polymerase III subunit delta' [Sulfurimonas paralvinellae]QOP46255.1 DNA polymerase III subunit delta' [Sulfurimonas paralvinellae]